MEAKLDERALWSCSYGIYVVTSRFEGKVNGQIANTVIQVSAEPPRISVAINKQNYTHELISKSGVFAVSVLDEDTPIGFIGRLGFRSGREVDKLDGLEWYEGSTGCPCVTENAISIFEARVFDEADVGTHTVFFGDVSSGRVLSKAAPMTYAQYHQMKGKAPKKAPTYRGEGKE